jgi:hypothetical protein
MTAWSLAFYCVLSKKGMDIHQIGQLIYEIGEVYYDSINPIKKIFGKWYYYSRIARFMVKRNSEKRRKRNYRGDFQGNFVKGDGKSFLWGYDYTECGTLKFLKEQHSEELNPYICLGDYALFRTLGVGFKRTRCLGMNEDRCDFRFIKNYQKPRGWPPNELDDFKCFLMKKQLF